MKLKSLVFSIIILHVFALGLSWILLQNAASKKIEIQYDYSGVDNHLIALPSTNLAYPVLTLFGKSYLKGEHPDLMSEIQMDSLHYSGWNPIFYPSFKQNYTDVYSLEGLRVWQP